ncbi:hypothetical protein J4468_04920 [Candidatus Woesearchaeota archaeon]|nr:hypothetical protein [Candidatus Woesearchaeota archaeon]
MAKVIITKSLEEQINKIFKKESIEVFSLLNSLSENPKKGKDIGAVGNILIKEIRYKNYRFYLIADRYKIKILSSEELKDLLIKFVRMSDKKDQQKVIDEIKYALKQFSVDVF